MKAVDTNILARFIVGDDPAQSAQATALLQTACYIPDTVVLETAWLLGSRYGLSRAVVAETLRDVIDLPTVTVSNAEGLQWAINRFAAGADLADMIHIHLSRSADAFVSFERKLKRLAGRDSPVPIERL